MSKETGGPAFPGQARALIIPRELAGIAKEIEIETNGMTLRDYFAASMGNGVVSIDMLRSCKTIEECELQITNAAALAYKLADAMLAERSKP